MRETLSAIRKWTVVGSSWCAARCLASYGILVSRTARVSFVGVDPQSHRLWLCWHENALSTLVAFVAAGAQPPPFLVGLADTRGRIYLAAYRKAGGDMVRLAHYHARGQAGDSKSAVVARLRSQAGLMTPDGPGGPYRVAKRGPLQLARSAGIEVETISVVATPSIRLPRWDHFVVPLPYSRIVVTRGGQKPDNVAPVLEID